MKILLIGIVLGLFSGCLDTVDRKKIALEGFTPRQEQLFVSAMDQWDAGFSLDDDWGTMARFGELPRPDIGRTTCGVGCEIVFGIDYQWTDFYFRHVAWHELGHVLGYDHGDLME